MTDIRFQDLNGKVYNAIPVRSIEPTSITTAERDLLPSDGITANFVYNGLVIYNSTTNQREVYDGDGTTNATTDWVPAQRISDGAAHVDASPYVIEITVSDATTYDPPLLGIRVGTTAGNVKVVSNSEIVTFTNVQIGETISGNITKVYSTDTTAAGIVGWYRA